MHFWYSVALCVCLISSIAHAKPVWENINMWGSNIGSLVPGSTYLEAVGYRGKGGAPQPIHLTIDAPRGEAGNATMHYHKSPPLFYVHQDKLWQYNNDTNILAMNVLNVSSTADAPLQMAVGRKHEGIGGHWSWRGTMLFYDHPLGGNQGIYYSCPTEEGHTGVFLFLKPSATPGDCRVFTIHAFNRSWR